YTVRVVAMCSLFLSTAAATPAIYTLSLHDALPIFGGTANSSPSAGGCSTWARRLPTWPVRSAPHTRPRPAFSGRARCYATTSGRSEEHTSELQSRENLVCRLLLEKKKQSRTRR